MLSPPDAGLARRDPSVRALGILLDPDALAEILRPRLPGVDLDGAEVTYVRYKPGSSCLAAFLLFAGGEALPGYAKGFAPGAGAKLEKRRAKGAVPSRLGPGALVLEEQSAAVSFFPNDAELTTLRELADPASWTDRLRRLLPRDPGLWEGEASRLAYKPERRYVALLRGRGGEQAVLKYYTEHGFRGAAPNAKGFQSRGTLRVARILGKSTRRRILALEWLPGRLLSETVAALRPDLEALAAAGRALAELHSQKPRRLPRVSAAAEGEDLRELAEGIGVLCPRSAGRAEALARRIAGRIAERPPAACALHGDFYANQVLVDDGTAALLDLDRAAFGDAASDLGRFAAHLERDCLRGRVPHANVEPARNRLLAGYSEIGPLPDPSRISLHTAAGLFRLAMDPFRLREPDWPERVEALLSRAEEILDRGARTPPGGSRARPSTDPAAGGGGEARVLDPLHAASDPEMPFLREALDPVRVLEIFRGRLGPLAGGNGEFHPLAIRVVRHKAGRRALIEYDLGPDRSRGGDGTLTIVGKVRAKGTDRSTVSVLRGLREAGFREDSEDGVCVPEALGVVPEFRMWLSRKAPGVPSAALLAGPGGPELAARIARAIRKVHAAGVPTARRHFMADELGILRERLAAAAGIHPRWAGRLALLLEACDRLGASVPEPLSCGIHRDFYPDQVLVDGERIVLLDFDLYCEGDPALDAGNFVGHLTEQALRTRGTPDALAEAEQAFTETFLRLAGERLRRNVAVYALLTLVRHISISTQIPGRGHLTGALLDLCEERLSAAERGRGGATGSAGPSGAQTAPAEGGAPGAPESGLGPAVERSTMSATERSPREAS